MKTAHLSWDEVTKRAGGKEITVWFDGIFMTGRCDEERMIRKLGECELLNLYEGGYQVMKWPERSGRS